MCRGEYKSCKNYTSKACVEKLEKAKLVQSKDGLCDAAKRQGGWGSCGREKVILYKRDRPRPDKSEQCKVCDDEDKKREAARMMDGGKGKPTVKNASKAGS